MKGNLTAIFYNYCVTTAKKTDFRFFDFQFILTILKKAYSNNS